MARVLVVEDESSVARAIGLLLEVHGFSSCHASAPDEALALLEQQSVDLVIQSAALGSGPAAKIIGAALFRRIKALDPGLPILVITDQNAVDTASQLIKEGTADYLVLPWEDAKLLASVHNLLRLRSMQEERKTIKAQLLRVRSELAERYHLVGTVFNSVVMRELVEKAVRIARVDEPVLVTGGDGVGKRKMAELIHANSERRSRPLVRVDAGAQDRALVEAEIFGVNTNASTGDSAEQVGALEVAAGATLLIIAVEKLSPAGQMRLLRVLQTGNFERLGSTRMQTSDARIIATAGSSLREEIIRGSFRDDLFFCLVRNQIELPALRDRPDDTLAVALHLLSKTDHEGHSMVLSEAARLSLVSHEWPGNVRELEERMSQACQTAQTGTITPDDLGLKPLTLNDPVPR